ERRLRANDDPAPELVVHADLAPARKLGGLSRSREGAAKRVRDAAARVPGSAEITADIEAGPVIGWRDRNVGRGCLRRRGDRRRKDIGCPRTSPNDAQRSYSER